MRNAFRILACIVIVSSLFAQASADEVGRLNKRANRLYNNGKYEEALKLYDDAILLDPSDSRLKMNRGSALYRMNRLDEAERSYEDALAAPRDRNSQADAHYNLGNILYRQGERLEQTGNPTQAYEKYSGARENFINTLKLRPNDNDAKFNLQLAHQKVEELKDVKNQPQQGENEEQGSGDKQEKDEAGQENDRQDDRQSDRDDTAQGGVDERGAAQEDGDEQPQQEQERALDEQDMKREEAERLIRQHADDGDSLSKPPMRRGRTRQPERDW